MRPSRHAALCGLVLAAGLVPRGDAVAAPVCEQEAACSVRKPLVLFVVDDSTSMNAPMDGPQTRWSATQSALTELIDAMNGSLQGRTILGLMRYGHDPDPGAPGTTLDGDLSSPPITDGQALDLAFYDPQDPLKKYVECGGEGFKAALSAAPAPLGGKLTGIESWTRGALDRAEALFEAAALDHPLDAGQRPGALVLITDGPWTDPAGTTALAPPGQNPAQRAAALYNERGIRTYVIALGEAYGQAHADEIAVAGGTGNALDVQTTVAFSEALALVRKDIEAALLQPACAAGKARLMILLDASSSMLNTNNVAGKMGETGWDQARDAIAGWSNALFDHVVQPSFKVEGHTLVGLTVFGHYVPMPGEQKVLVDYGVCTQERVRWALDPNSSCDAPGCVDPWSGPPIVWTFQDGSQLDPPGFKEKTLSHMPKCDKGAQFPMACVGSGTYTHLGLQLVQANMAAYKALCPDLDEPCDDDTRFVNILVTDGKYNSTSAQVQAALVQLFTAGVTTYVIGFGDATDLAQLDQMAAWGSGGAEAAFDANNQLQLEEAFAAIADGLPFDPCCEPTNCDSYCEPYPCPGGCGGLGPVCGDDVWCLEEECDDGNLLDGDGCSATCTLELEASSSTSSSSSSSSSTTEGASSTSEGSGSSGAASEATASSSTSEGSSSGAPDTSSTTALTTGVVTTSAAATGEGSAGSSTGGQVEGEGCGCRGGGSSWRSLPALLLLLGRPRRKRRA